jgi:hypothetical protein
LVVVPIEGAKCAPPDPAYMALDAAGTDKGVGFGVLFGILAVVGALAMLAAPGQLTKAGGFALAMVAALCSVVAIQAYA